MHQIQEEQCSSLAGRSVKKSSSVFICQLLEQIPSFARVIILIFNKPVVLCLKFSEFPGISSVFPGNF